MALLGIGQTQAVNEPFTWGAGGRRMTPEDIAMQRQVAEQQRMAGADFSPAGSIWEGLGRVVQGYSGGEAQRRMRRAEDANRAESESVVQALLSGGDDGGADSVLSALANPYISDQARQIAMMQYQRMNPEPAAPTEFARLLGERGIQQGSPEWNTALDQYISGKADPLITTSLPGDRFYSGPQSQLAAALGGGQPPATPTAPVGTLTPIEPTMQNTPPPELGASGAPATLTPDQYRVIVDRMGPDVAADWAARHGVRIGG